jgi:hypothetical protein
MNRILSKLPKNCFQNKYFTSINYINTWLLDNFIQRKRIQFFKIISKQFMKKILIINGHPNSDSFNFGIFEAYKKGAISSGVDIKEIIIKDLIFNPNLQFGFQKRTELEPDLIDAWGKIKWADHLVWVHPV